MGFFINVKENFTSMKLPNVKMNPNRLYKKNDNETFHHRTFHKLARSPSNMTPIPSQERILLTDNKVKATAFNSFLP